MNVFIITEGNAQTGYGHLTRCLAIYQGFEENGIKPTIIANCDENGEIILGEISLQVFNWVENSSRIIDIVTEADIVVIDSYLARASLYEKLYRVVNKAVYIDDTLRLDYPPGVILNGAVGAENLPYKKSEKHTYFLGLKFAPLRKEFWDLPERDFLDKRNNVLITIGGQDIRDITFDVLDAALKYSTTLNYHVVLGFNEFKNRTMAYAGWRNITFYHSLSAEAMRDLMLVTDIAISAAGQTSYELYQLGIPMILIQIAKNQQSNVQGFISIGAIQEALAYDDEDFIGKLHQHLDSTTRQKKKQSGVKYCGVRNIVKGLLN